MATQAQQASPHMFSPTAEEFKLPSNLLQSPTFTYNEKQQKGYSNMKSKLEDKDFQIATLTTTIAYLHEMLAGKQREIEELRNTFDLNVASSPVQVQQNSSTDQTQGVASTSAHCTQKSKQNAHKKRRRKRPRKGPAVT